MHGLGYSSCVTHIKISIENTSAFNVKVMTELSLDCLYSLHFIIHLKKQSHDMHC